MPTASREISGRGLAVCDHFDTCWLNEQDPLVILTLLVKSDKHRRAWLRYVTSLADTWSALIREAQGNG